MKKYNFSITALITVITLSTVFLFSCKEDDNIEKPKPIPTNNYIADFNSYYGDSISNVLSVLVEKGWNIDSIQSNDYYISRSKTSLDTCILYTSGGIIRIIDYYTIIDKHISENRLHFLNLESKLNALNPLEEYYSLIVEGDNEFAHRNRYNFFYEFNLRINSLRYVQVQRIIEDRVFQLTMSKYFEDRTKIRILIFGPISD